MHVLATVLGWGVVVVVIAGVGMGIAEVLVRLARWLTEGEDDDFWNGPDAHV